VTLNEQLMLCRSFLEPNEYLQLIGVGLAFDDFDGPSQGGLGLGSSI